MNIVAIHGQTHKGSTYQIAKILIDKLSDTKTTLTEFFLPAALPYFCTGCAQCIIKGEPFCPHYMAVKPIAEALEAADLIILTSPVYVYHITGQMKACLDHFAYRWMIHRPHPSMFTKQAVCISTAAGAGMKSANKDLIDSLMYWGIGQIHTYGAAVRAISWDHVSDKQKKQIAKSMERLAAQLKRRNFQTTPSFKTKILFYSMRSFVKNISKNKIDVDYWKEMEWLDGKKPWSSKIGISTSMQ